MTENLVLREHARVTTTPVEKSLDQAQIPEQDFDWLCELRASWPGGAQLIQFQDRRNLRLDNHVGVLETPSGRTLEILPKHIASTEDVGRARYFLVRALSEALDLPYREGGAANLQAFHYPVFEWVIHRFLRATEYLIHRGIRQDYKRVEEELRHLRGQLDVRRQIQQPPGRTHRFQVTHDLFTPDRPENRLIRLTLDKVLRWTRAPENWRLARKLQTLLSTVPPSRAVEGDLDRWEDSRLMATYRSVRPWCELLLRKRTPLTQAGGWRGHSMLFPMERLFERFVARRLARAVAPGCRLREQSRARSLCEHRGKHWFNLQPDLVVYGNGEPRVVLDTKWKGLDAAAATPSDKYHLDQQDLYQLFAYGQKYLEGQGELFLIYPRTTNFEEPLPPFHFSPALRLWVVPFDLESGLLVPGKWLAEADWLINPSGTGKDSKDHFFRSEDEDRTGIGATQGP